jgi:hypothetical protein
LATGYLWTATGRIAEILNDFEILVTLVRTDTRVKERHRHCSLTAGHHLERYQCGPCAEGFWLAFLSNAFAVADQWIGDFAAWASIW